MLMLMANYGRSLSVSTCYFRGKMLLCYKLLHQATWCGINKVSKGNAAACFTTQKTVQLWSAANICKARCDRPVIINRPLIHCAQPIQNVQLAAATEGDEQAL